MGFIKNFYLVHSKKRPPLKNGGVKNSSESVGNELTSIADCQSRNILHPKSPRRSIGISICLSTIGHFLVNNFVLLLIILLHFCDDRV